MIGDIQRLHHKRATRNKTGETIPHPSDGANGDIRIVNFGGAIYIFAKYKNRWYNAKMKQGFDIIETKK